MFGHRDLRNDKVIFSLSSQLVGVECVALVAIVYKALPAPCFAFFVGGYNFCHPWKRGDYFRYAVAEIDQQITIFGRQVATADRNRRSRFASGRSQYFMRHETAIAKRPEKRVEPMHALLAGNLYVDPIVQSIGLFSKPAGKLLLRNFATPR